MLDLKQRKKLAALFEIMADPKAIQIICEIGENELTAKSLEKNCKIEKDVLNHYLVRLVENEIITPIKPSLYRLNESSNTSFILEIFSLFLTLKVSKT